MSGVGIRRVEFNDATGGRTALVTCYVEAMKLDLRGFG
jgi:hypothetical protein